jgi:hypothetical protein
MKEQIEKLLRATPFVPFVLEIADNVVYAIATADHAFTAGKLLVIADDDGTVDIVPYGHIRRIRTKVAA